MSCSNSFRPCNSSTWQTCHHLQEICVFLPYKSSFFVFWLFVFCEEQLSKAKVSLDYGFSDTCTEQLHFINVLGDYAVTLEVSRLLTLSEI